jgi:hypothetical protein
MTPNDAIAKALATSHALLKRYTADLTAQDYLHRPSPTANCAAWTIGHLVLTERRCLGTFGVTDLPPLPDGFDKMFSRDEGCPQASTFGDVSVLMPLFDRHRERLIDAVRRATPQQLDKPLETPRPPMFVNAGEQALFMATHVAMHAGQITLIRRSLGRPPLV